MVEVVTYLLDLLAVVVLVQIVIVDIRARRIPNVSVGVLVILWAMQCVLCVFADGASEAIGRAVHGLLAALALGGGSLLLALIFERITGKQSLGGGDIKLIAVLVLILGVRTSLVALFLASILSVVWALVAKKRTMPFAPFIVSGVFISVCLAATGMHWCCEVP